MEAIKGKNIILLFRLLKNAASASAAKLAFQVEHSVDKSRDSDTTETKDGPITVGQGLEEEISYSCIMGKKDPVVETLETAINSNEVLEVWEVDVTEKSTGEKYPAKYRQGLLTEKNETANAEDLMEMECTFVTNGLAQSGEVTLTAAQEAVVQYKFRDTTPYTEA